MDSVDEYRLPTELKPLHYDITIRTDLEAFTFHGFAAIHLKVVKETSNVVFNSDKLQLHAISLVSGSGTTITETTRMVHEKSERVAVQLSSVLPPGSMVTLNIGYEGKLDDSMAGYYRSSTTYEGKKRYYALTQFQPTAARRAFPCWDEPLLKATYTITMISRADTVNLSNMPARSEAPYTEAENGIGKLTTVFANLSIGEGWKITKFDKTPPISSYIVAFANGHFEHLESSYTSPLSGKTRPLRIYATSDLIHQAQFALDVKAKVIPLYEKVFDIEFPLPKLDTLVANDFDLGAMENWGLITGRTSVFLLDPVKFDVSAKKRSQRHKATRFGNIVTMEWWDNLYLNEGFATLMGEVIIIDKVFPEWRVSSEFITNHLGRALELDAKRSSHPIEVACPDANQINQIFDALSYSKAGSILRMLAAFVGEDNFLRGVSIYLKKRLYGSSVTKDLWDGISEALATTSNLDVARMMENWTSKIGFPVLQVTETGAGITVRQDRFLETNDVKPDENETIWHIPLNIFSVDASGKGSIDRKAVLDKREASFKLDTSKPFKVNAGTTGVYRVSYSPSRLAKIADEAAKKDSLLTLEDRMGLVADSMVLAKSGHAKTSGGLNLILGLKSDEESLVWTAIATHINNLVSAWWEQPKAIRDGINAFRRHLFSPLVEKYNYDVRNGDSDDVKQLRTLAIAQAAHSADTKVISELQARFKHFVETGDDSRIPPDLMRPVYRTVVRHGGHAEYEAVKKVYLTAQTPSAKMAAMYGMTGSSDPIIIEETLQYSLGEEVNAQDVMFFFIGSSTNPFARRAVTDFALKNFDTIHKRFENSFSLSHIVKSSFQRLSSEKDLKAIEDFFKDRDCSKFDRALAQSLDEIRGNAAWIERAAPDVAQWLEKFEEDTGQ